MIRWCSAGLAGLVAVALTSCGGRGVAGHEVEGDKAFKNLDKQVMSNYKDQPWFGHITKANKGLIGYGVHTDYGVMDPAAQADAVAICNAFVQTSPKNPFVKVFGIQKTVETNVDGSKETHTKDTEILATTKPGGDDYLGKCEPFGEVSPAALPAPADENAFLKIVLDAKNYKATPEEQNASYQDVGHRVLKRRNSAICQALGSGLSVHAWVGKVRQADDGGDCA